MEEKRYRRWSNESVLNRDTIRAAGIYFNYNNSTEMMCYLDDTMRATRREKMSQQTYLDRRSKKVSYSRRERVMDYDTARWRDYNDFDSSKSVRHSICSPLEKSRCHVVKRRKVVRSEKSPLQEAIPRRYNNRPKWVDDDPQGIHLHETNRRSKSSDLPKNSTNETRNKRKHGDPPPKTDVKVEEQMNQSGRQELVKSSHEIKVKEEPMSCEEILSPVQPAKQQVFDPPKYSHAYVLSTFLPMSADNTSKPFKHESDTSPTTSPNSYAIMDLASKAIRKNYAEQSRHPFIQPLLPSADGQFQSKITDTASSSTGKSKDMHDLKKINSSEEKEKMLERMNQWFYRDSENRRHGPYPHTEMARWYRLGRFHRPSLVVRRSAENVYYPLHDLIAYLDGSPFVTVTSENFSKYFQVKIPGFRWDPSLQKYTMQPFSKPTDVQEKSPLSPLHNQSTSYKLLSAGQQLPADAEKEQSSLPQSPKSPCDKKPNTNTLQPLMDVRIGRITEDYSSVAQNTLLKKKVEFAQYNSTLYFDQDDPWLDIRKYQKYTPTCDAVDSQQP